MGIAALLAAPLPLAVFPAGCGRSGDSSGDAAEAPSGVASPGAAVVARVGDLMTTARVPGLSLAVIRDGEVVRSEVLGVADRASGRPVTEDTLFEAASLSKPVFATIVLRMAERGELDLDRPLLDLMDYERLAHEPRARLLTARMVLSHQTGLPNWGGEPLELERDPGEAFGYSGEGYVLLQRVLEATTGLSLDELARREVLDPLAMTRSRFALPEGAAVELAFPHDRAGRPQSRSGPREGNAAHSLLTTAPEYARFAAAWLDGELLSHGASTEALEPAILIDPDEAGGERLDAPPLAWGLGWGIQLPAAGTSGSPIYWHWGDNGPSKAFVAFDRDSRRGLVYFANGDTGLAIGPALVAEVVGEMGSTFEWLGYDRSDAPGFSERLDGAVAESEGRYAEAVASFRMALVADPEDEQTARRVEWLTELLDRQQRPLELSESLLRRYAGTYGPRVLTLEDGALHYQRGGGSRYRLVPLAETLFALDGLVDFRLEVAVDARGEPTALIGHYLDGETDESARDPELREAELSRSDSAPGAPRGGGSRVRPGCGRAPAR
jgi:CubicO group peptidase (beta-lactamase class C family)